MDVGSCYFYHGPTERVRKSLRDLSWVVCDPAILPNQTGNEPSTNTEGQFIYVKNYKDRKTNWWNGILRTWEVTRLTDSRHRGVLLELCHPPTPRTRVPFEHEIPMDSDEDSVEEDSEKEKQSTASNLSSYESNELIRLQCQLRPSNLIHERLSPS